MFKQFQSHLIMEVESLWNISKTGTEIFKTNFNRFYTISKWNILQCLST